MRTFLVFAIVFLITVLIVGCATAPTLVPPTATSAPPTATPIPPTATTIPSPTAVPATSTPIPTATPFPTKPPPPTAQFSAIKEPVTDAELSCIEGAIGVQATADLRQRKRTATSDEQSAIDKCRTGADNPRNHEVYVTTSADGLNWAPATLLSKTASVPGVVRTSKGILWVYWVDFANLGPDSGRIGIAKSTDGIAWEKMGFVQFSGLGQINAVDPDVIELADGRLRMYFYDIAVKDKVHPIYSAISTDGINYTLEAGIRFQAGNIYDPNVIRLKDGRYRMYLNRDSDITSATSADGLTFTDDGGVRLSGLGVPGAIVLPDGTIRLYHCGNGITVSKSSDGLAFGLEKEGVIRAAPGSLVCSPSVTAIPTGYLMVYNFSPAGIAPPPGGKPTPLPGQGQFIPQPQTDSQRQCIDQKIGAEARQTILDRKREPSAVELDAFSACVPPPPTPGQGQLPPPKPTALPGSSSGFRPPAQGFGAFVVVNHFGQDATFTVSAIAGRVMHLAKDGGNEQWNLPPGMYTFSANVPGTKIDCSKYNGCTMEITLGKNTIIDLW